jgi:hypothetical protein
MCPPLSSRGFTELHFFRFLRSFINLPAASADPDEDADQTVKGKFVKFDADTNEITLMVEKENMTYKLGKDAKVTVGEVKDTKDLSKLKADQIVFLTLKTEGTKTWVTAVSDHEPKPNGSGKN